MYKISYIYNNTVFLQTPTKTPNIFAESRTQCWKGVENGSLKSWRPQFTGIPQPIRSVYGYTWWLMVISNVGK